MKTVIRPYVVPDPITGKARLVETYSPASAVRHVMRAVTCQAKPASASEVADLMDKGVKLERPHQKPRA